MKTICELDCEDCGPSAVLMTDFITVTKLADQHEYISRCRYCHRTKTGPLSIDMVEYLVAKGVVLLDWLAENE